MELSDQTPLRHYDKTQNRLSLSAHASPPTQIFQLCLQFALITEEPLLEATLDLARFQSLQARDIAKIGFGQNVQKESLEDQQPKIMCAHKAVRRNYIGR